MSLAFLFHYLMLNMFRMLKKLKAARGAFSALQLVGRLYPCPQ